MLTTVYCGATRRGGRSPERHHRITFLSRECIRDGVPEVPNATSLEERVIWVSPMGRQPCGKSLIDCKPAGCLKRIWGRKRSVTGMTKDIEDSRNRRKNNSERRDYRSSRPGASQSGESGDCWVPAPGRGSEGRARSRTAAGTSGCPAPPAEPIKNRASSDTAADRDGRAAPTTGSPPRPAAEAARANTRFGRPGIRCRSSCPAAPSSRTTAEAGGDRRGPDRHPRSCSRCPGRASLPGPAGDWRRAGSRSSRRSYWP